MELSANYSELIGEVCKLETCWSICIARLHHEAGGGKDGFSFETPGFEHVELSGPDLRLAESSNCALRCDGR